MSQARCLLQSDIVDVNQIFTELGTMVHEQGEMIGECVYNSCFCKIKHSVRVVLARAQYTGNYMYWGHYMYMHSCMYGTCTLSTGMYYVLSRVTWFHLT